MVDSRESMELHRIEQKIDGLSETVGKLSARVDTLSATVDTRFDEVSQAFVQQREYTEFAFETLRNELLAAMDAMKGELRADMNSGFGRLDRKLDRVIDSLARTPSPRRRRRS
jgi:hypothetical protein